MFSKGYKVKIKYKLFPSGVVRVDIIDNDIVRVDQSTIIRNTNIFMRCSIVITALFMIRHLVSILI